MKIQFANPWALLLLLLVPTWLWWIHRRQPAALTFARAGTLGAAAEGRGSFLGILPDAMRAGAFAWLVIALAGPRTGATVVQDETEGIAIVVAVDASESMLAEDMRPRNRLGAAKQIISRFIQSREHDRIALVAFGSEAMTRVPLTHDHAELLQSLTAIRGAELGVGTAIGDALAASANRLRRAPEKSKVVVLMSDGVNNSGVVAPIDAARAARALGIRVYTIGVGTDTAGRRQAAEGGERVRYVLRQARIDEGTMADIARTTGGRYFRARDTEALGRIYREIDRMERTPVQSRRYVRHRDWYLPFLLAGAVLLILEWLFRATRWGRVP